MAERIADLAEKTGRCGRLMTRRRLLGLAFAGMMLGTSAQAKQVAVRYLQLPMHTFMVTRSGSGKVIGHVEFTQTLHGDEATMRLTFRFSDGSIDDETTTFRQQGFFHLIRDRHIETGPFFGKTVDFAVDATTGTATSRTTGRNGKAAVETEHINLPNDLANGIVGTLLVNVPETTTPFRVGILAPVD
ncbi:MAG TPA: hypothetical protein VFU68_08385, partial [Terracidiphilus sp.]|nr:hypothetical protein [Terracidiphilus sp.]